MSQSHVEQPVGWSLNEILLSNCKRFRFSNKTRKTTKMEDSEDNLHVKSHWIYGSAKLIDGDNSRYLFLPAFPLIRFVLNSYE